MGYQKGESGNPRGRPPGVPNKISAFRKQLYDALPGVLEVLIGNALAGDPTSIKLLLERTLSPLKPGHAPSVLPITSTTPDEQAADLIYQSAIDGELDSDHAASLLNLIGARRQLVADIQAAQVPQPQGDTGPLEQLETVTNVALQSGRLDLAVRSTSAQLPYKLAHKEPDPPQPVGRVEVEPIGLDGEEWERKYGGDNG